jgi:glucose uptake protein
MFVPATFAAALVMTIVSTICWGSWANTYKLTKSYRFEIFYWDYALGIVAISVVLALTMGKGLHLGDAAPGNLLYAAVGGFIFNVANVLLVAGIEIAGLAVAFPIAIGIALVVTIGAGLIPQPVLDFARHATLLRL